MSKYDYDLIIVGAGPAGIVSSIYANREGLDVLLIEKEEVPRIKTCGGAISVKAENTLKSIDIELDKKIIENDVYGINIHKPDGDTIELNSREKIASLVKRENFDYYLLQEALNKDIDFLDSTKVQKVTQKNKIIKVFTEEGNIFRSKSLIGADGALGVVAKSVNIRNGWKMNQSGLCLQAEPAVDKSQLPARFEGRAKLEIYFGAIPSGYAWLFPKDDCVNIGIGGFRNKVENIESKFKKFCSQFSFLDYENIDLDGQVIPAGGFRRKIQKNNILLAGDAAGFVDSFGGEGIYYALSSGIKAAKAVSEYIINDDKGALKNYELICRNSFHKELKASLKLSKMIHSRTDLYLSILQNDKKSQRSFIRVPTGKTDYNEFYKKILLRAPLTMLKKLWRENIRSNSRS